MDAMNLLHMLFSTAGASPVVRADNAQRQPVTLFMPVLQQQFQSAPQATALSASSATHFSGALPTATGQEAGLSQAQPPSIAQLLDAWISALRQSLATMAGEPGTDQALAADNGSEPYLASPAGESGAQALPLDGDRLLAGSSLLARLLADWHGMLARLNAVLFSGDGSGLELLATDPLISPTPHASPAVPWALATAVRTGSQQTATWPPWANATSPQTRLLAQGLQVTGEPLSNVPDSIRWFTMTGNVAHWHERTGGIANAAGQARAAEILLANGESVRIVLTPLALPNQDAGQLDRPLGAYDLRVAFPGDEGYVLSARLFIQCERTAPMPQTAAAPTGADDGGLRVAPAQLAGPRWAVPPAGAQPVQLTPTAACSLLTDAPPGMSSAPWTTAAVPLTAVAVSSDLLVPAAGQSSPLQGLDPQSAARHVPLVAAPVPPTARASTGQVDGLPFWEESPAPATSSLDQSVFSYSLRAAEPTRLAQQQSTVALDPLDPAHGPIAPVTHGTVAPQLLQFTGNGLEITPYFGLQYLEMAERVFEQVARARDAGNGLYHARLDLNPPNLGRLVVNISVRGDAVALQLACLSNVPKEQLKDSLEALRQSLEEAGLYVAELRVIEIEGDEERSGGQQNQSPDEEPREGEAQHAGTLKTTPALVSHS